MEQVRMIKEVHSQKLMETLQSLIPLQYHRVKVAKDKQVQVNSKETLKLLVDRNPRILDLKQVETQAKRVQTLRIMVIPVNQVQGTKQIKDLRPVAPSKTVQVPLPTSLLPLARHLLHLKVLGRARLLLQSHRLVLK